jgi:glutamate synthase domain-containing protein 2
MRYMGFAVSTLLCVLTVLAAILLGGIGWIIVAVLLGALVAVGIYDVLQRRHSILRNYPILGHMRFILESIRPELQQYFIERNYDGRPFDRDTRTSIYERAKAIEDEQAYGTERDMGEPGYEWLLQSISSFDPPKDPPQVKDRRAGLRQALRDRPAQRVGDELRGPLRKCPDRAQPGSGQGWVRP